jgi:hypothetical protein
MNSTWFSGRLISIMEISFPENRGVVNLRAAESHGKSREVLIALRKIWRLDFAENSGSYFYIELVVLEGGEVLHFRLHDHLS